MPAGAVQVLLEEMVRAKQRCGLPAAAPVMSCYEAGRDGCGRHRFLGTPGVENQVVDSASIEVNRRHRRVKPARLDAHKLLPMVLRHGAGEPKVGSVVRVPSEVDEDRRQRPRELLTAPRDRPRGINRLQGLLAGGGYGGRSQARGRPSSRRAVRGMARRGRRPCRPA
jgi:transposase